MKVIELMRIVIITGPFLPIPPGPAGAVEKSWFGLAKQFATKGNEVILMSRSWPTVANRRVEDGITILARSGYRRSGSLLIDLVKDLLYSLSWLWRVPESDVVIANSFWLPALLLHRKPISPAVFVSVERYPKGQLRLYKKAKRLRAPTQAVQSAILAQLPSFSNRTVVIPNPIDTEVFSPTVRNIHKSTKRILYTGRIHPEKGIHILINAFRIIAQERDDVELHITGEMRTERGGGGKTYGRKLERLARGFPVTFNPSIDSPRLLADALHSADYYCYPSLSENGESFGVAPLEAMSTGLAPIVSSLSCFSDFIEEGKTGYLFDHRAPDPEVTLANVLRSALNGSAKHIRMGLAAHKKSLEFSFESVADAFLAAFVR